MPAAADPAPASAGVARIWVVPVLLLFCLFAAATALPDKKISAIPAGFALLGAYSIWIHGKRRFFSFSGFLFPAGERRWGQPIGALICSGLVMVALVGVGSELSKAKEANTGDSRSASRVEEVMQNALAADSNQMTGVADGMGNTASFAPARSPSDVALSNQIVGTWRGADATYTTDTYNWQNVDIVTRYRSDGTYTTDAALLLTGSYRGVPFPVGGLHVPYRRSGTWQIKGSKIIGTATRFEQPNVPGWSVLDPLMDRLRSTAARTSSWELDLLELNDRSLVVRDVRTGIVSRRSR